MGGSYSTYFGQEESCARIENENFLFQCKISMNMAIYQILWEEIGVVIGHIEGEVCKIVKRKIHLNEGASKILVLSTSK